MIYESEEDPPELECGILMTCPTLMLFVLEIQFSEHIAETVVPYLRAISERVSPLLIVYVI